MLAWTGELCVIQCSLTLLSDKMCISSSYILHVYIFIYLLHVIISLPLYLPNPHMSYFISCTYIRIYVDIYMRPQAASLLFGFTVFWV